MLDTAYTTPSRDVQKLSLDFLAEPIGILTPQSENEQKINDALKVMFSQIGINLEKESIRRELAKKNSNYSGLKPEEKKSLSISELHDHVRSLKTVTHYTQRQEGLKNWREFLTSEKLKGPANIAYGIRRRRSTSFANAELARNSLAILFKEYPTNYHLLSPRELAQTIVELEAIRKYIIEIFSQGVEMSAEFTKELIQIKLKINSILDNEIADAALQLTKNGLHDPSELINNTWKKAFGPKSFAIFPDEIFTNGEQEIGTSLVIEDLCHYWDYQEHDAKETKQADEEKRCQRKKRVLREKAKLKVEAVLQDFLQRHSVEEEMKSVAKARKSWEEIQADRSSQELLTPMTEVFKILGLNTEEEKKTIVIPENADKFVELTFASPVAIMSFVEELINVHWREYQSWWSTGTRKQTLEKLGFEYDLTKNRWNYRRKLIKDFCVTADVVLNIADSLKLEKNGTDKTSIKASDLGMLILRAHSAFVRGATSVALDRCRELRRQIDKIQLNAIDINAKANLLKDQVSKISGLTISTVNCTQAIAVTLEKLAAKNAEIEELVARLDEISNSRGDRLVVADESEAHAEVESENITAQMGRLSIEITELRKRVQSDNETFFELQKVVQKDYQEKLNEQKSLNELATNLSTKITELNAKVGTVDAKVIEQEREKILVESQNALKKLHFLEVRINELELILGKASVHQSAATLEKFSSILASCSTLEVLAKDQQKHLQEEKKTLESEVASLKKQLGIANGIVAELQESKKVFVEKVGEIRAVVKDAKDSATSLPKEVAKSKEAIAEAQMQAINLEASLENVTSRSTLPVFLREGLSPKAMSVVVRINDLATGKSQGMDLQYIASAKALKEVCKYLYEREISCGAVIDAQSAREKRDGLLVLYGKYLDSKNDQDVFQQFCAGLKRQRLGKWYDFFSCAKS